MFKNKFEIPISVEAAKYGLALGEKVYSDKLKFKNKWLFGGNSELQADIYGFIAETVVCDFFGSPWPKLTPGENDVFDLMIGDLRVDVKKISNRIALNKKQFYRKRSEIDAFLFCTFTGEFNNVVAGDPKLGKRVFVPVPIVGKLNLLGYIKTEDVERKSKMFKWENSEDEAYGIPESKLNDIKELIK